LAFDRDATLKQGEKVLRQGRLDAAIAEYARVVDEHPRDLTTANLLGDLYVRASQPERALEQYRRIADSLVRDGLYPKASALFRKILKLQPEDEQTRLVLADMCAKQGQLQEAKQYLTAVGATRRARGDKDGAADVALRLSALDPSDIPTRLTAARTLEEMGWTADAAGHFRSISGDLRAQGRAAEALDALRDAVRLNPGDRDGRTVLARTAVEAGDIPGAAPYLDRDTAGQDPMLIAALVELELRAGHHDAARELMTDLLGIDPASSQRLLKTAWALVDTSADAAYHCIDAIVNAAISTGAYGLAAGYLQAFGERRPHHIPSLLRLVEVTVDGDLAAPLNQAQARLADAYLEAGQPAEARVIAEDLVAREPGEPGHVERLRRALIQLEVPDPEACIAERLAAGADFFASLDLTDSGGDVPLAHNSVKTAPPDDAEAAPVRNEPAPVERLADGVPVAPAASTPYVVAAAAHAPAGEAVAAESPVAVPAFALAGAGAGAGDVELDQELDLTSLLGGSLESGAAGGATIGDDGAATTLDLDSVFSELREDLAGETASDESAAQYMKLARTYVDMGMVDEAISALQTPARAPRYRFDAAALLGRLHFKRGETAKAVEWFERAADVPAPTVQDGRALLYDLGVALDGAGEASRALAVFLELQADAGDYRDVPARIDRLARV
jgi:tetratricopeptide (TPR) repeat protein